MAVKLILVGLLACLTVRQQAHWADDVALWRRAAVVAPSSPRAALNLAMAYRKSGQIEKAVTWLIRSAALIEASADGDRYRPYLRAQIVGMEITGHSVCHEWLLSSYC